MHDIETVGKCFCFSKSVIDSTLKGGKVFNLVDTAINNLFKCALIAAVISYEDTNNLFGSSGVQYIRGTVHRCGIFTIGDNNHGTDVDFIERDAITPIAQSIEHGTIQIGRRATHLERINRLSQASCMVG